MILISQGSSKKPDRIKSSSPIGFAFFLCLLLQASTLFGALPECSDFGLRHNCIAEEGLSGGVRYKGEYQNNMRRGVGLFVYSDGWYFGEHFMDKPNGKGTRVYSSGDIYEGNFLGGEYAGLGAKTYSNGDHYVGSWEGGKFHGQGIYRFANGAIQEGLSVRGVAQGLGSYTFPNGDRYSGEFKDGDFHGKGVMRFAEGITPQEGVWERNAFVRAESIPKTISERQSHLPPGSGTSLQRFVALDEGGTLASSVGKVIADISLELKPFVDAMKEIEKIFGSSVSRPLGTHEPAPQSPQAIPRSPEVVRGTMSLSVSASVPDENGIFSLRITTGTDTASLRINGDEVGGRADGSYSVTRFAGVGVNQFEIVAIDRYGTTQRRSVSVARKAADSTVKFANLNPLTVRPRAPRDAVAILIGIQDYRRLPKAEFANNDAKVFYDYAVRGLGIRGENIKMLLDHEADEVAILSALKNWLPLKVRKNQTEVFVFYSGHGLPSNDGTSLYLLPHGVDRQFLERTAINQEELVASLQAAHPRSVTIFLDACYSGQTRGGESLLASTRPVRVRTKASKFPDNFTVISASAPEEQASSSRELSHGIFSYWLMKGIEGGADANKDGQLTAAELEKYLTDSVSLMSVAQGRVQRPQAVGDLTRILVHK